MLPIKSLVPTHYLFHPSLYVKFSFQSFTFSTIRNFADLDLLFSCNSFSFGIIGFLVISLKGASNSLGNTGRFFGVGFSVLHALNACLAIRSSKEWKVITAILPLLETISAA